MLPEASSKRSTTAIRITRSPRSPGGWNRSTYLRALDRADREESDIAEAKSIRLKEKIAGLRQQMLALRVMEQMVQDAPDQQVSLTDPDARSMATSGSGIGVVGQGIASGFSASDGIRRAII